MEINIIIIITLVLLFLYISFRVKIKNLPFFLGDSFILGLLLYTAGAAYLYYINPHFKYNSLFLISSIALISGVFGNLIGLMLTKSKKYNFTLVPNSKLDEKFTYGMLFFSVLVSSLFIYLVVSNKSILAEILYTLNDKYSNYNNVRKTITSGSEVYFAPGYIKQFRDIMAPIALVTLLMMKPKGYKRILLITFPVILLAMLISGQRSIILTFFLLYYFVILYSRNSKSFRFNTIFFIGIGLSSFYGLSLLLGRSDATSFSEAFVDSVIGIFERVVLTVPSENTKYFYFWWDKITYGASWGSELERVLPGVNMGFSNTLHNLNDGSLQGNSVLGMPVDIYYAFGFYGLAIVPFKSLFS